MVRKLIVGGGALGLVLAGVVGFDGAGPTYEDPPAHARAPVPRAAKDSPLVWTLNRSARSVTAIDPTTRRTRSVRVQWRSPVDMVYADGVLWVVYAGGPIQRLDARTGRSLGTADVAGDPGRMFAAPDGIYVEHSEDGFIGRHDPATGARLDSMRVPDRVDAFFVGDGGLRVVVGSMGRLYSYARGGSEPVDSLDVEFATGEVVMGLGSAWLYQIDGTLFRLDPESGALRARIETGGGMDARGIAVGEGAVWVASLMEGELIRVDPATDRVVARIPVGGEPESVAVTPGAVWVALTSDDIVVRVDAETGRVTDRIPVDGLPMVLVATR
jgi:YVTN family beta-propeller protein